MECPLQRKARVARISIGIFIRESAEEDKKDDQQIEG
jgi:hypothetical protein